MGFLAWLEATGLAEWARSSSEGYPSMITLHAFGMAIMVGLSLALDLRLLGKFAGIPYTGLQRSVTQIDSSVRPSGGTGRPRSNISLRSSAAVSGCAMADCTPTRTRPSA